MGILEIIGELFSPGPIGKIGLDDKESKVHQKFIPIRFFISVVIIGMIEYFFVFQTGDYRDFNHILKVNIILVIYLLIALNIEVKPKYENLGWVPFLVNNPFRFSDNINRFLVVLFVLFLPGKYITSSFLNLYRFYTKDN